MMGMYDENVILFFIAMGFYALLIIVFVGTMYYWLSKPVKENN